ncbi:MAG TPA: hypothetical protein VKT80_13425 [Chloroflexota bacterium]|nr:hypothetical protein [Chloroflexota bacterium]
MDATPEKVFPIRGEGGRRDWIDTAHYSVAQRFFLGRLERLVGLKGAPDAHLEAWQQTLVNRAIYSTYCDCVEQGLADIAQGVIHREKSTPQGSAST